MILGRSSRFVAIRLGIGRGQRPQDIVRIGRLQAGKGLDRSLGGLVEVPDVGIVGPALATISVESGSNATESRLVLPPTSVVVTPPCTTFKSTSFATGASFTGTTVMVMVVAADDSEPSLT